VLLALYFEEVQNFLKRIYHSLVVVIAPDLVMVSLIKMVHFGDQVLLMHL
jgi:hypothetical protein